MENYKRWLYEERVRSQYINKTLNPLQAWPLKICIGLFSYCGNKIKAFKKLWNVKNYRFFFSAKMDE